jgi:multidrug efflux pump subunit AcrA (membrane-fusion protein)
MTAKVRFLSPQRDARLSVPLTAVFQQDGQPALWVVQADQSVALRPVAVASYGEDTALTECGVQAGERIVVAGVHKLTAGERVSVVEQPDAGGGSCLDERRRPGRAYRAMTLPTSPNGRCATAR